MFEKAKIKSEAILADFSVVSAPVPIEQIIRSLDIKISYAPSINYSGILIRKTDKTVLMGINNNESFHRIRFTMAHELGHYLLDNEKVSIDYRSKNCDSKNKSIKEKRADFFAANLLMPESFIVRDFKNIVKKNGIFWEKDFVSMANKYQVSKEALKYRLINLKLIHAKS